MILQDLKHLVNHVKQYSRRAICGPGANVWATEVKFYMSETTAAAVAKAPRGTICLVPRMTEPIETYRDSKGVIRIPLFLEEP